MNSICTFYINKKRFGTIHTIPVSTSGGNGHSYALYMSDRGNIGPLDLTLIDTQVPDERLRNLSTTEYFITRDSTVIIKDRVYKVDNLPTQCQFKAIPILRDEVVECDPKHVLEEILLNQGYAKDLVDSPYLLIPPQINDTLFNASLVPLDLLVRRKDGDSVITRSGRIPDKLEITKTDGKFIYLSNMPQFSGEWKDSDITYSTETLITKYNQLQDRLQEYGKNRVLSLCKAMESMKRQIGGSQDQFKASSIYDDVVKILERVRTL